jgi:cysteine-rich repeat protein
MQVALCAIVLHSGCLREFSTTCGNGGVCPPGLLCVDTDSTTVDGEICAVGTCGNGRLDPGESCDDSNNRAGDGCPADCAEPCGDGVRDPREACDDGNTDDRDGCSADCQSRDGMFRVSPPMVSFAAVEGDELPAAVRVTVHFEYVGDTVLVGYASGVPQPSWLSIAEGPTSDTAAELELRVTDTSAVGSRSTSVRLLISHQNSTGLETVDLPVSYNVARSTLAIEATPMTLAFTASPGDVGLPAQAVHVTFDGTRASLLSAPAWAAVSAPTAETSPVSFAVSIRDTSFQVGTELSDELVFRTTRGQLQRTASVRLTYHVVPPPDLAIQAAPGSLEFAAVAGGAVPPAQPVSVTFSGADVSVVSAPAWLTVARSTPVANPTTFSISVNSTSFAAGTTQSGDVVFRTSRGPSQRTTGVRVDYRLRSRPEVQFVAPYVGVAGRSNTVRIRGRGFATGGPVTVRIGQLEIGPVVPDGDTQITVAYPALPEGRYPVTLVDPTAIAPMSPELVIVAPPAFGYQAIAAPGVRKRILFDAERGAIYGVNRDDQDIEHFAYANHRWSVQPPHIVPLLTDIALAPDGRSLVVLDRNTINEMSLTDGRFAPVPRIDNPDPLCGGFFDQAVSANNGQLAVITDYVGCSGWPPNYLYDLRSRSLSRAFDIHNHVVAAASGDGSRIYAGSTSLHEPITSFDSLSRTFSSSTFDLELFAISVSENASRVITSYFGNHKVYGRSLVLTGNLPGGGVALASRDSTRAFIYVEDAGSARLEVYNLDGALQPDALYPLLGTVMLPDAANGAGSSHPPVAMTSNPDDTVVFISGDSKLLVVPVGSADNLSVQATPAALAFTAPARGPVPSSQSVDVMFNGTAVAVLSAPPWLTVSAPPGPLTSPASFAVTIDSTAFQGGTTLSGDIVFVTTRGMLQLTTTVHVDYRIGIVPDVWFVAPYVGIARRGGTVHVRGKGFQAPGGPVTISIGDVVIGPVVPDSDTQITLNYPGLPEGRYPVTVSSPPGIAPDQPELVIVTPHAFRYQALAAPGFRRIAYDAERQAIYALSRSDQRIDLLAYAGGLWSTRSSHVIPGLADIALMPNGRSLIVVTTDRVHEIALSDDLFTPVVRAENPAPSCGGFFDQLAAADDGKFFLVVKIPECSNSPISYLYDRLDRSLTGMGWLDSQVIVASGDGSRIYGITSGFIPQQPVMIFDALSSTLSRSSLEIDATALSVSGDASRVILQNSAVYSRSLMLLGELPLHGVALASRDSRRAFVYIDDVTGSRLEVYNLDGPLGADGHYPLLRTVTLPDSANGAGGSHAPVAMTSSLDDSAVFVSGDSKLLVVPVN